MNSLVFLFCFFFFFWTGVDELNSRNKFGAFQAGNKKGKEVITTDKICIHPPYQMKEFGECLQNLHQKISDCKHISEHTNHL